MSLVDAKVSVDFAEDDISDVRFDRLSEQFCDELEVVLDAELDTLKRRVLSHFPQGIFTIKTEVDG